MIKKWFGKIIFEEYKLRNIDEHRFSYKKYFLGICYKQRANLTLLEAINEFLEVD